MKKQILSLLTLLFLWAPTIQAATICNTSDVTAAGTDAFACKVHQGSNDDGYADEINADFGLSSSILWDGLIKSDDPSSPLSYSNNTWSISAPVSSPFVVVIKAADNFASYLFTSSDVVYSGTFSLIFSHLTGGQTPQEKYYDLSHISIYTTSNGNPVPLPAALWLFGPALLGFMGFRRKIKS